MLTTKQQQNRAYYAANAERIRARKRQEYQRNTVIKEEKTGKPEQPAFHKKADTAQKKKIAKQTAAEKLSLRRRIEDRALGRELGVEEF
ncbi:hypothetical protein [Endozoicomonas ascidiicola]|uniref:hypothetical protein n=1 Tax=Endozoicomonas ascidiicola TaxID=1698521 RepID=UPI00082B3F23|nr:hypothetical protein [Endozoicomonas ascidiicola]